MIGINTQIINFKQEIANVINESNLPVTVVQIVLQTTLNEVNGLAEQVLMQEQKQKEKESESNTKSERYCKQDEIPEEYVKDGAE